MRPPRSQAADPRVLRAHVRRAPRARVSIASSRRRRARRPATRVNRRPYPRVIWKNLERARSSVDDAGAADRTVTRDLDVGENPSFSSTWASNVSVLFAMPRAGLGIGYL